MMAVAKPAPMAKLMALSYGTLVHFVGDDVNELFDL